MLSTKNKIKFLFTVKNHFYDIVCIGHTAQKVAQLVEKLNKKVSIKNLFIQSSPEHFEPSLAIFGKGGVQIYKRPNVDTETRLRNDISKIDANKNVLLLKNGQQIKFKHLIFSGEDHQWKDVNIYKGLKEGLESPFTDTFADTKGSNVQSLYSKVNNDIYFSIPSSRHFGMDNYFMIHLANSLRNLSQIGGFLNPKNTKIKVLNNGQKFNPFNDQIDQKIRSLLNQNRIQVESNVELKQLNHRKREFTLNKKGKIEKVKYGGFFQYLPFKVPDLLKKSSIDPLDVNHSTLLNNKNPTIHVIGNITPTVYSFYSMNYMAHTVAKNILNMELKSEKRALYEGDSVFPFWTGSKSLRYFAMNYKQTKSFNNIGQNKLFGQVLGLDRKMMGKTEVSLYLNGSSYGMPNYIMSPKIKQAGQEIQVNQSSTNKILSM